MCATDKFWYCDDCDQVSADAKKADSTDPFFDSLALTCPDGEIESIDISSEVMGQLPVIRAKLPTYCRTSCENVFNAAN